MAKNKKQVQPKEIILEGITDKKEEKKSKSKKSKKKNLPEELLSKIQDDINNQPDESLDLATSNLIDELNMPNNVQPVSTELLDDIKKIAPTLTTEQVQQLIDYIKGGERPDFVDLMLTQTNGKLTELLKVMSILQLIQLPKLFDYQRCLQENLLNPEAVKNMTAEDISAEAVNIQKQINDILVTSLKINTQTSPDNTIPTKVEKIANQLMGCSEATRNRVIEILEADQQDE